MISHYQPDQIQEEQILPVITAIKVLRCKHFKKYEKQDGSVNREDPLKKKDTVNEKRAELG